MAYRCHWQVTPVTFVSRKRRADPIGRPQEKNSNVAAIGTLNLRSRALEAKVLHKKRRETAHRRPGCANNFTGEGTRVQFER